MSIKELRVIAVEMGIPAIKKAIQKENNKLRAAGQKDIADAIDAVLSHC